ncbi:MAG: putative transposase [halophilic archaeon J07HX5]|nr:MAG: putative transposase [halophilic archaeon J07HX5]
MEVVGDPKRDDEQGRLEIQYDEVDDTFRAFQPVTAPDSRQDSSLAEKSAALDMGANNLVACTTTTGQQYLYEGRDLFADFHETTEEIARLQSKLLKNGTVVSGFANCTGTGHVVVTTHRTRLSVISWSECPRSIAGLQLFCPDSQSCFAVTHGEMSIVKTYQGNIFNRDYL